MPGKFTLITQGLKQALADEITGYDGWNEPCEDVLSQGELRLLYGIPMWSGEKTIYQITGEQSIAWWFTRNMQN